MMVKLVPAHTMDPFGPFWGTHPTEKYVHTKAHPFENFRRNNTFFATQAGLNPRWGAKCQKCQKPFNQGPITLEIDL